MPADGSLTLYRYGRMGDLHARCLGTVDLHDLAVVMFQSKKPACPTRASVSSVEWRSPVCCAPSGRGVGLPSETAPVLVESTAQHRCPSRHEAQSLGLHSPFWDEAWRIVIRIEVSEAQIMMRSPTVRLCTRSDHQERLPWRPVPSLSCWTSL